MENTENGPIALVSSRHRGLFASLTSTRFTRIVSRQDAKGKGAKKNEDYYDDYDFQENTSKS